MIKEGHATPGKPETPVLKPVVTDGFAYPEKGKIVSTEKNQETGHLDTPGTYKDYL